MKPMQRVLSLLLVAVMLAMTVVSCGKSDPPDQQDTTTTAGGATVTSGDATTTQPSATTNLVTDDLPENLNYNGETIRIISRDSDWVKDEIYSAEINGDLINDAVYDRNTVISERLGVVIQNYSMSGGQYAISNEIRNAVKADTDEYDIVANSAYSTIMYTAENIFRNLYDCEYLDLEKPYWAQGFNDAASIGKGQYMCTGAAALTLYRYMFVTFFNKNMFQEHQVDSLYGVVNDGKWTLEYQYNIASQFYSDLNGNGQRDESDRFGFMSTNQAYIDAYWSSCRLPILLKDENNAYTYSVDIGRMSNAVDKILQLWFNCDGSNIVTSTTDAADQLAGTRALSEGRAATTTLRLVSVESAELRNMSDEYGIVPMPKMEEAQDGYQTFIHDQFTAFGIMSTVTDNRLQMMGAFLEAMASESYKSLVPTYYELALKTKYVSDEESGQMLDLIYEGVYIDAGVLYTKSLGSVHQQLRTVIKSKNNTVASVFAAQGRVVQKQLANLIDGLLAIQ